MGVGYRNMAGPAALTLSQIEDCLRAMVWYVGLVGQIHRRQIWQSNVYIKRLFQKSFL